MKPMPETSNMDKAAILLLSMGEEAAAHVVRRMSRDEVIKLSNHMSKLSGVPTDNARNVIQDFFNKFSEHSGIGKASRSFLEKTLDLALGKRLAQDLVDGIYGDELREDFQKLQWVPPETLAKSFSIQHSQMQAVLLAFLPPESASEVLAHFPKENHDDLIHRVAKMTDVGDNVIEELKITVKECMEFISSQSSAKVDGVKQAADIINRYQGDKASLIEMLKIQSEDLAKSVLENMYDFESLIRQSDETLQALVEAFDNESLAVSLKGSDPAIKKALLGALPKRMSESIVEQIDMMGGVTVTRVDQAKKDLMTLARELNEDGTIQYQIFEEKVVE
jgi:flagellar motor switch protein FliG